MEETNKFTREIGHESNELVLCAFLLIPIIGGLYGKGLTTMLSICGMAILIYNTRFRFYICKNNIYIVIPIVVIAVYHYLFTKSQTVMEICSFCYCIITPLLLIYKIDAIKLLRYITWSSVVVLIEIQSQNLSILNYINGMKIGNMSVSYAFVPASISAIILVARYKKNLKWPDYIPLTTSIYLTIEMLRFGNRGPVLCVITAILLLLIQKLEKSNKKGILIAVMICIISSAVFNGEWLIDIAGQYTNFVGRFLDLERTNTGYDSGRIEIYEMTIKQILSAPLLGSGFNNFTYNSQNTYPHNCILEIMYSCGVLMGLIVSVIMVRGFLLLNKSKNENTITILICLISISFPHYLVSGDVFSMQAILYWTTIMYINQNI